jgi:hypothetical protein
LILYLLGGASIYSSLEIFIPGFESDLIKSFITVSSDIFDLEFVAI